ncbi:MAG TPA: L,D-transpeptidase family protein, partial [Accumulibacter sp.]|nr:L,D-transpeptidase family protein [Accumulibacter sp.]
PSIAKGETLPRLRRDPGYLQRAGMEFVAADGRVAEYSPDNLDAVERGQLRLRQKPGRSNALGQIKFILPNTDGIYLHHTPTPQLFRRDRRDFSHGCVRVEAPVDLATFVLANQPAWSRERIVKAMAAGRSSYASLSEALPVIVNYQSTVFRDGRLYFFSDIYAQDKNLELALQQRAKYMQTVVNNHFD